jgi:L-asparaginase II
MNSKIEVSIFRGAYLESRHTVDAVVLDSRGGCVESFGDPLRKIFPRSAIKPLQSLLLAKRLLDSEVNLQDRLPELALATASHRGEARHLEVLDNWQQRLGIATADFQCGVHAPYSKEAELSLVKSGKQADARYNNCSGKHLGFLDYCLWRGYPIKGYHLREHPLQEDLFQLMIKIEKMFPDLQWSDSHPQWSVDGCSIPTYYRALKDWAQLLLPFLNLESGGGELLQQARLVHDALVKYPLLLGGEQSLSSKVIIHSRGEILAKTGAEGVFSIMAPKIGWVAMLKADDGATRASEQAVLFLIDRLLGSPSWLEELRREFSSDIRNWSGDVVGSVKVGLRTA